MFCQNGKGACPAKLKSDLAPGSFPVRSSVGSAAAGNGIELCADESRYSGGGHRVQSGHLEQPRNAQPVLRLGAVVGQVIKQGKCVSLT